MLYQAFYNYLRNEVARSPHTVTAYVRDLEDFRRFYREELRHADDDPRRMLTADLRLWISSEASKGLKATSVSRKVHTLRSFFNYLVRHHGLAPNPSCCTPRSQAAQGAAQVHCGGRKQHANRRARK